MHSAHREHTRAPARGPAYLPVMHPKNTAGTGGHQMMTVRRGAVLDAAMDFWRKWLVAAALGLVGLTLCLSSASLPAKSSTLSLSSAVRGGSLRGKRHDGAAGRLMMEGGDTAGGERHSSGRAQAILLRIRGGAAAASVQGVARFFPWSYPSIVGWAFALVKMAAFKILSMMGMGGLVGAMFGWGDAVGDVSDALGGVGELGGTKAKKVPLTEKEIELKAAADKIIAGASFKEDVFEALRGKPVTLVTNGALFLESDLLRSGDEAEKSPPKIFPEALASLLKLAGGTDLYLITQLPHSGCTGLNEYFEQHTVPSILSPHGVWQDDKMELAVRKSLHDAGVFAAGMDPRNVAFCESIDGRGYIARNIGEELTRLGRIALHVDDAPLSVEWLQNVCRNTTVVAVETEDNRGNFSIPKNAEPPVVVSSIAEYFEAK